MQPQSLEEEGALIRQRLEEQRRRQHEQRFALEGGGEKQERSAEEQDGGGRKKVGFDDVVEMLQETKDPKKVVEKLREVGLEVEEVSERAGVGYTHHYGWIVRVGDRYIAIASGHRVGRGDVGDYVVMELPDEGAARNFLAGRYWGTSWGEPEFVRRAAAATEYERGLDRWMREELGKAGYRVERIDWPEGAPARGFTYIIYDREGRKIGEVQVAKTVDRYYLINTGLPRAVMATNDPRRAALYFIYKHETGDENLAWRLATGDERAKELYVSKVRYEEELKAREQWFHELTQRGLKPIVYSKIDGRAIVSENDLWLDEKTGVTYRVVLEREGDRITMKLAPASERDERMLALRQLEREGFRVIDDMTVERDGVRYVASVEERGGKKVLRLEPHSEDAKKAAEREVWWELWRQGFTKRGGYAVKDGVKYKVEVEEQDGRYVAKLTPVGPASPEEESRRYRRGDWRGSLEGMRQLQFTIEKLGLEKPLSPEELAEELRFGGRRPRDVPYIPVLDETFYGAFGVPLSQALFHPATPQLYQRYATATLPGSRIQGFTLPERWQLERAAETQRLYAERFEDVWTPLSFRAPTERDVSWRTAVATAAEAFTFWIPVAKGATALAAARGLNVPLLTAEKTVTTGRGVRLPRVPGDYFEVHYVEPRKVAETVRSAFVAEGVGEGVAIRGKPGHWELVFARSAKQPKPGWVFEFATVTYRDVAEWLRKIPSIGIPAELRPRVVRFAEVRGFARDLPGFESPRFEPPKFEPPRGREVKVEWAEPPKERPPVREPPPKAEPPAREPKSVAELSRREPKTVAEGVQRAVAKVTQAEEELVRPIRAELPMAQTVKTRLATAPKAEEEPQRAARSETRVETAPVEIPVKTRAVDVPRLEERVVTWPVETPARELGPVYIPTWTYEFTTPAIYPFEIRNFETPVRELEVAGERELETARYDVWAAETPERGVRTAETPRYGWRTAEGFAAPPPPPAYVRGGYGWGRESAHALHRPPRLMRRGWRVYEVLRI